jgi:ABC-type transport system involved in multi-copper enzyme maturation permease subunit
MTFVGPVFAADLRCHSRRAHVIVWRFLCVALLLLIFYFSYRSLGQNLSIRAVGLGGYYESTSKIQLGQLIALAANFSLYVMLVQFFMLLLVGPSYVAGAIAEEKQRGTLEYLLASDLSNCEIVFGKFCSRFVMLFQFVLLGLPVIALVQLIGGVSMQMILGMSLGTLGPVASLTAISLWLSVLSRRGRDALIRTYLVLLILFLAWYGALELQTWVQMQIWTAKSEIAEVLQYALFLNPFYVLVKLRQEMFIAGEVGTLPLRWFGLCCAEHMGLAFLVLCAAGMNLRRRHMNYGDRQTRRGRKIVALRRPTVDHRDPLFWKEKYVDDGSWRLLAKLRFASVRHTPWLIIGLVLLGGLALLAFPFLALLSDSTWVVEIYAMARWAFPGCFFLALLVATLRTASGIGVEKEKQTWEALLLTPIETPHLLWAKIYGGFLSARWLWLLSLLPLAFSVAQGRFLLLATTAAFAMAAYGWFTLTLAAWFSLGSPSTIRAVLVAITCLLVLNAFPFLIMLFLPYQRIEESLLRLLDWMATASSTQMLLFVGLLSVGCVVLYYRFPRARWLFALVKWLGIFLLLLFLFMLMLLGVLTELGINLALSDVASFFSPVCLYGQMLWHFFLVPDVPWMRISPRSAGEKAWTFIMSSGICFATAGFLALAWAQRRLRKTCGRAEYAMKKRRRPPAGQTPAHTPNPEPTFL